MTMASRITVLGSGMVGYAMCVDLAGQYEVTAVDRDPDVLKKFEDTDIRTRVADLSEKESVLEVIADADLVIGAVPGFMGARTLRSVIEAGKNIVDISFFPEDPFSMDDLARQNEVVAVTDAGVAPGMSNVILGYHNNMMDIQDFMCFVGGLPKIRTRPYEYKAPFSPIDIIEEYTRPARYRVDGRMVTAPALSDPELIDFPGVGTLEAFNTDGLRSLLDTMDIPNMKEKTLRFPGHITLMKALRETGFFSDEAIQVGDHLVKPIDLTTKLLYPLWKLEEDEEEFTVMQIQVQGTEDGTPKNYRYDMVDHFDADSGFSSMARTTGFACTAIANLVLDGSFHRKGISPPEYVGANTGCFDRIMGYLADRGIKYVITESNG